MWSFTNSSTSCQWINWVIRSEMEGISIVGSSGLGLNSHRVHILHYQTNQVHPTKTQNSKTKDIASLSYASLLFSVVFVFRQKLTVVNLNYCICIINNYFITLSFSIMKIQLIETKFHLITRKQKLLKELLYAQQI